MKTGDGSDQTEPETVSRRVATVFEPVKALENVLVFVSGNSGPVIGDRDDGSAFNDFVRNDDLPSGTAMFDRIVHEIGDGIEDQVTITSHQHLAITDNDVTGPPFNGKKSPNVEGLTYATQENSYLVGCLAGLMVKKQGGTQTIGVVGGVKIPPVDAFLAGYKAGATKCNPGIKVLIGYSQDFIDQAKCKTVAQNQIDAGSQVEFNVAGPCGLGTLDAANEAGIWGIGVDVDQAYLHPAHILTSAVKHVDTGVYLAIKGAENGQFKGGTNLVFNLKNNGVGVGKVNSNVPAKFIKQINGLRAQIIAGKIKPPAKLG